MALPVAIAIGLAAARIAAGALARSYSKKVAQQAAKKTVQAVAREAPKAAPKAAAKAAPKAAVQRAGTAAKQIKAKPKGCVNGCPKANGNIRTVGGRKPINSKYAGKTHPSGVRFKKNGFPDFKPYAKREVTFPKGQLTGGKSDFALANKRAGFPKTPKGHTWHHVENGRTLQLVPRKIHDATKHTGGSAIIRNGGLNR